MPWILASSAYSFHQLLPSWLWSPAGCILESVLGPWGSSGVLFFLVVFLFLPFPVYLVLLLFLSPIFLFLLLLFFLLSPPFLLSFLHFLLLSSPSLLLPAFSLLLFLPWLLLLPSVLQLPTCSSSHSFVSFCYFAVFCRFLFPCLLSPRVSCSSFASRLRSTVASCPFYLSSLPVISFRPLPPGRRQLPSPVLSFPLSPSLLLSCPWCLPPPSFSLLFFCFFSCSSCLLFVIYDFCF